MAIESAIRLKEVNVHIDPYKKERPPKHHQVQLLDIMERDLGGFSGSLLDVGCASGAFLALASERFPEARLEGVDVSEELVGIARDRLAGTGARLSVDDATSYRPAQAYDAITASGVHSIFDDPVSVYTATLADGRKKLLKGANMIAEKYFLTVKHKA